MRHRRTTDPLLKLAQYWREARILTTKLERASSPNREKRLTELNEKLIPKTTEEVEEDFDKKLNGK